MVRHLYHLGFAMALLLIPACSKKEIAKSEPVVTKSEPNSDGGKSVGTSLLNRPGAPRKDGRKVALLVAVQDYSDSGLSNLKYCENDVNELAAVLKAQGYKEDDIIVLTDTIAAQKSKLKYVPTAEHVRKELKGLIEDLRIEDTFLVAFSGHGVHLKALKERDCTSAPRAAISTSRKQWCR